MRTRRCLLLVTAVLTLLPRMPLPGGTARAQDESENNSTSSSTYDSTGKVTAIAAPLTITVDSRRGPFSYQIDPDVHAFGADGKPIKIADVRVGQTVTVYYYKRVGQETVARLVVHKNTAGK